MPVQCFCNTCGSPFTVKTSRASATRYCSYACRSRVIEKFCVSCGKSFKVPLSVGATGGFFCSAECYVRHDGITKQAHMIKALRGKHLPQLRGV